MSVGLTERRGRGDRAFLKSLVFVRRYYSRSLPRSVSDRRDQLFAEFVELVDEGVLRSLAAAGDRRAGGLILLDQGVEGGEEQSVGDVNLVGICLLVGDATGHVEPLLFMGSSGTAYSEQIAIPADGGGNRIRFVHTLTLAQFGVQVIDRGGRTAGELRTGCLDFAIGFAQ